MLSLRSRGSAPDVDEEGWDGRGDRERLLGRIAVGSSGGVRGLRGLEGRDRHVTILWLLSDEASFTTGAFIDVAGGRQ